MNTNTELQNLDDEENCNDKAPVDIPESQQQMDDAYADISAAWNLSN